MVHHSPFGDGVAHPGRPTYLKGPHSQSFTAGSNPNSAPMPSFRRSYTPQPEPTFDLMASTQPMFGDANFRLPNMPFDLQGPISMGPPAASYSSGLPAANFADTTSTYNYDPSAFDTTPFSRPPIVLAPPVPRSQAPTTDSMHKNHQPPQTPRKILKPKSTPLAPRDPNVKRALPDSPTIEHTSSPRKAAKRSKTDEPGRHREMLPIPDAESFPAVDAGEENSKPPYTYAQMIALAIWKAPSRRRTLSQIYDFVRTTWCYYRKDDTWENSIRHNLSLHKKFFDKQARAKDDPGKGNYWLIIPGNERELLDVYLKEKAPPPPEPMLPPPRFALPADPSSDATIPASDHHAFDEPDLHDNTLDTTLTSSPPAAVSRRASAPRDDTPTRVARMGGSSSGRTSGKRKRYSMVDSGYMTGLDSSIVRYGQQRGPAFSSDADNPEFHGGGRAEDAIRKLRASSNESPSRGRATRVLPPSSSPTPAHAQKKSALQLGAPSLPPPKTVSKYKNSPIRQHEKLRANVRSMLETPQCIRDYNKKYRNRLDVDRFAIFEDNPSEESPLVANSAGRMLDELMSAKKNQKTPMTTSSPFKNFPLFPPNDENAPWHYESPSKVFSPAKFSSPSKYLPDVENNSWIGVDLGDLGEFDEAAAVDLTQTFRSIGERPAGWGEAYGPTTLRRF